MAEIKLAPAQGTLGWDTRASNEPAYDVATGIDSVVLAPIR